MNRFMELAINEARQGIHSGHGGPFGSVIIKNGKIIASDHNRVLVVNDPTHHGEIGAIRKACESLGTYDLTGCEIYTTGEPCPMCLCACMWANIEKVYYGCTIEDNEKIGFRDNKFDKTFGGRQGLDEYLNCIDRKECLDLFEEYNNIEDRIIY